MTYEDGHLINLIIIILLVIVIIVVGYFLIRKFNNNDFIREEKKLKSYLETKYYKKYISLREREVVYNKLKFNVYLMKNIINEWNKNYIKRELDDNDKLFSDIDGISLDKSQREIVIIDDDILVSAGVGSGKTLTITAKIKYLFDVKGVNPNELLLLSLDNKATNEMPDKLKHRLNVPVSVTTFNELGSKILKDNSTDTYNIDFKGKVVNSSINEYLEKEIKEHKFSDELMKRIVNFVSLYMHEPEEEFENNIAQYDTLQAVYNNKSNQREFVKSFHELQIANYLFLHDIKYVYQKKYDYIEENYYPDFYLPDYDIYLEHFEIDKKGNIPNTWSISSEKYNESIRWKREVHKRYGTTMVESYSYWHDDFIDNLEKLLELNGIECKRVKTNEEIYDYTYNSKSIMYLPVLKYMIKNFINLYKVNDLNKDDVDIISNNSSERTKEFLKIAVPVLNYYNENLKKENMIDINDMLYESIKIIKNNKVKLKYKYIFVDEFQDISKPSFELIKAIKKQTKAKLICVGDEWQSIYKFTGSNLNYLVDFEKHNDSYELLELEKNYRNPINLIDVAGKFVVKNDIFIKNDLWSNFNIDKPLVILKYDSSNFEVINVALKEIEKIEGKGNNVNIMVLSRYEHNNKSLNEYNKFNKIYPNFKIEYTSMYSSKGLESDYVIILDMSNSLYGMPSKIKSDQVVNNISNHVSYYEDYPYAEERRLFYVSLTRAKRKVFLAIQRNNPSVFIEELDSENIEYIDIPK